MSQWIIASPKDKGYSWMILIGGLMMNVLIPGAIWKTFGILFLSIQERFQVSSAQLSWVPSLIIGLGLLMGTPANILVIKTNTRTVALLSGCLLLTGFITSIFATNILTLYVTYGVCLGVGSGLIYSPAVIIVGEYFSKKRTLANGIASSGSGIAGIIFPIFIRYCLNEYGLNGTLLLMAGCTFNICVAGMLFRPHIFYKDRYQHNLKISKSKNGTKNISFDSSFEIEVVINNDLKYMKHYENRSEEEQNNKCSNDLEKIELHEIVKVKSERKHKVQVNSGFDWYLIKYPTIILYAISGGLSIVCYTGLIIMSPPHAEMVGYTPTMASMLISIMGVVDIISRISIGLLANKISPVKIFHASLIVNTFALSSVALFGHFHYVFMAISCSISAACAGAFLSLLPIVISEVMGIERLRSSFALVTFVCGIANLVIPFIYGWLRDVSGSWDLSFYFCASISASISLLNFALPLARRYSDILDEKRRKEFNL